MNRSARTWWARARGWVGAGQRRSGRTPTGCLKRACRRPAYAPPPCHTRHTRHTTCAATGRPATARPATTSFRDTVLLGEPSFGSRKTTTGRPSTIVLGGACLCARVAVAVVVCRPAWHTLTTVTTHPRHPIADDGITRRPQPAAVPIRKSVAGGSWGVGGKDHLSMDGACAGAEGQPRWRASTLSHSLTQTHTTQ